MSNIFERSRSIERDLIMESANYKRLIDGQSFINTADGILNKEVYTENVVDNMLNKLVNKHMDLLDNSVDNFNQISSSNTVDLLTFFNNIRAGIPDNTEMTLPFLSMGEVVEIRPEYLSEYIRDAKKNIKTILSDNDTDSVFLDKYKTNEYANKMKRKLVKSSIPIELYGDPPKPDILAVNDMVTATYIIPFLTQYQQMAKSTIMDVQKVKSYIRKTSGEVRMISISIDKLIMENTVSYKMARKLSARGVYINKRYLEIITYLTVMTVRKMSVLSFNLTSICNLYNMLNERYPAGDRILHESVLNGRYNDLEDYDLYKSLLDGSFSITYTAVDRILDKKADIFNKFTDVANTNILDMSESPAADVDYRKADYDLVSQSFRTIRSQINKFTNLIINGEDIVFVDVINASGLNESFANQFQSYISIIGSVDPYIQMELDPMYSKRRLMETVYSDLSNFPDRVTEISDTASAANEEFDDSIRTIEDHVREHDNVSVETVDECISYLKQLRNNFNTLVLSYAKALVLRISKLDDLLTKLTDEAPVMKNISLKHDITETEYLEFAHENILHEQKYDTESLFAEMQRSYKSIKSEQDTGYRLVFEEGEEEEGSATKPKFSIVNFIRDLLAKWRTKFSKLTAKYSKWLENNKKALLDLDTTNITIELQPFDDIADTSLTSKITTDIGKAISGINTIRPENIHTYDNGKIMDIILKDRNQCVAKRAGKQGTNPNFSAKVVSYYMYGPTSKGEMKSFSGPSLKTRVSSMIAFCENYDTGLGNISSSLTNFANAVDLKTRAISTGRPSPAAEPVATTTTNESMFLSDLYGDYFTEVSAEDAKNVTEPVNTAPNAPINTPKKDDNKIEKEAPEVKVAGKTPKKPKGGKSANIDTKKQIDMIEKTSKDFSTGIATAYEARYTHYMSALKRIMSSTTADVEQTTTEPEANQ